MPDQNENVKEVVQPAEGTVADNSQTEVQSESLEKRPSSEDHNWREVRDKMQRQDRVIEELKTQLDEKENVKKQQIDDPLANLADDDVVTVGDTKKIVSQMARKYASEIIDEKYKKHAIDQVPNQFNDYNEVIKLVDEYVKENPAAEAAIRASPNPRLAAYHMVKSSQLYHTRMSNKDMAQKAVDNSKKPMSSQSVGTSSPLNDVGSYEKMTPDRAAQIRKLAEEYASKR